MTTPRPPRVLPVPNEPGRYLVRSDTGGPPWLVDLFFDEHGPACACWVEHNRADIYRECKHVRWAKDEHEEIKKWDAIEAADMKRRIQWAKSIGYWPKRFGPPPPMVSPKTTD